MRTVSVRITDDVYQRLLKLAKRENRSMSRQVAHMIASGLQTQIIFESPRVIQLDEMQLQRILVAIGGNADYLSLFQPVST
ncbi:hypothetical protein LCGC14_1892890 [marine sediment metagenome]|uniref:Uncharacterized protein n=1 Tax=marine sediment metagenome TaxID=412755 RepID=A0A0F9FYW8_9ZZZZ